MLMDMFLKCSMNNRIVMYIYFVLFIMYFLSILRLSRQIFFLTLIVLLHFIFLVLAHRVKAHLCSMFKEKNT